MNKPPTTTECNERFAKIHGLTVAQVKYLKGMITKAANAWVKWNNEAGQSSEIRAKQLENMMERAHENADAYAKKLGFEPDWGVGLYPTLHKGGKVYYLPD